MPAQPPAGRARATSLLRGHGRFVADLIERDDLIVGFLRSAQAHARLRSIDTEAATRLEGVVAIWTSADLDAAGIPDLPVSHVPARAPEDPAPRVRRRPVLARDYIRFVGEPVAMVAARDASVLAAALEAIEVDAEDLPACVDPAGNGSPDEGGRMRPEHAFIWRFGQPEKVREIARTAWRTVTLELKNNRIAISPIEPRAIRCAHDPASGRTTVETASQGPYSIRNQLADMFACPRDGIRVITRDVGGSFGMKIMLYQEHAALTFATRRLGRPVAWVASRGESFQSDYHGRDHVTRAQVTVDSRMRLRALSVDTTVNLGAYLAQSGALIPTEVYKNVFGGCYGFDAVDLTVRGVYTNMPSTDAYRGAGVPEAMYLLERIIDVAARDLGVDRAELRRENFIASTQLPCTTAAGARYDVGDFRAVFDRALQKARWASFQRRRADSATKGLLGGIGCAAIIHGTGGHSGADSASVSLDDDGRVHVHTGAMSTGQPHDRAFRAIAARGLGLDGDQVVLHQGDSTDLQNGGGTGGSSSLVVSARTISFACDALIDNLKTIAARHFEAAPGDMVYAKGTFTVAGTDRRVALTALPAIRARLARDATDETDETVPPCTGTAFFDGERRTYPYGTHVCEVEIDPATYRVRIVAYTIVEDIGDILDQEAVLGQVHGAVAQGIGQALLEAVHYAPESGQLLTGSFMDYGLPRGDDCAAAIEWENRPTRSTNNPLGYKGVAELGTIGAPPAIINAVCDALDLRHIDMPATGARIHELTSPAVRPKP